MVDPLRDRGDPRGADLAHHAEPRSLQADRVGREAGARRGGRAELEVAVHLSRLRRRLGQRAGGAGRHAGRFPPDRRIADELLLHPAARHPGLRDAEHADAPAPDRRRSRHLPGPVGGLQRPRLLGHALQDLRHQPRRIRRLDRARQGRERLARRGGLRAARAAQREERADALRERGAGPVRQHRRHRDARRLGQPELHGGLAGRDPGHHPVGQCRRDLPFPGAAKAPILATR